MKVLVVLVAACIALTSAAYSGYSGPQASPVVNPNGFLADTPEVAAAKAAHFSEVAKVSSPSGYAPGPYNGAPAAPAYHGAPAYNPPAPAYNPPAPAYNPPAPAYNPPAPVYNPAPAPYQHAGSQYANPSVTPEGYLADTPDVAAAKAAHFAEVAKTKSSPNSYGVEEYDDGSYKPEYDNPSYSAPAPAPAYSSYSAPAPAYSSYSAPAPAPAYPSYSAPAPAPAHHSYSAPQYAPPAPSHSGHYQGPLAKPVVTPQGFLADTPEVAAAKAAHFSEVAKVNTHAPAPAPAHHGGHRYRRSAVLVQTPAATAPLVAYSAPVVSYYAAPYSYLHAPSGYAYSVRTW